MRLGSRQYSGGVGAEICAGGGAEIGGSLQFTMALRCPSLFWDFRKDKPLFFHVASEIAAPGL